MEMRWELTATADHSRMQPGFGPTGLSANPSPTNVVHHGAPITKTILTPASASRTVNARSSKWLSGTRRAGHEYADLSRGPWNGVPVSVTVPTRILVH